MAKHRVLLNINANTFFPELHRFARVLQASGQYEPLMFFGWDYATMPRDIRQCLHEGLFCIDEDGERIWPSQYGLSDDSAVAGTKPFKPLWKKSRDRLRYYLKETRRGVRRGVLAPFSRSFRDRVKYVVFDWVSVLDYYRYWKQRLRIARKIMQTHSVRLLVIGGDMIHYDTAVFVKVAHELGLRAIIVPTTMSDQLEMAESYFNSIGHDGSRPINRLLIRMHPKWAYTHKGKTLVRMPAAKALPVEWLGFSPPNPWILHSGHADAIAVESKAMAAYYKRGGLPENLLVPTGSPANDRLAYCLENATGLRADLFRRLDLPLDLPILLTGLPPDQHYLAGGRPQCDFKTYEELVDFWMSSISNVEGFNRIVCLHPSVSLEDWKYLEAKYGVKIATETTAELIPLCDLFVASVSSVIRWSIAAGKPVLNYDIYKFHYRDYLEVEGVLTVQDRDQYLAALKQLTTDPAFLHKITAAQVQGASYWGETDGRAGERILALCDRFVEAPRATAEEVS